jgi:membrane-associated phospholipid phosphatase
MPSRLAAALAVLVVASPAAADDTIPGHTVHRQTDALITGGAAVTALAMLAIPVNQQRGLWSKELFDDLDRGVHDNFSRRAGRISDVAFGLSVVAPVIYLTGSTIDDADGDRLLLYGETVALNLAVNAAVKFAVQRPRPYLYSNDPGAGQHAKDKGRDSRLSFYSGHASTTFCSAVSGAYLLGTATDNGTARALAWSVGLGAAAATANLRVRAGEHFYSDVIIGAVIGTAISYAVPALHADDGPLVPSENDVALAGVGVLAGVLASQLIPLEKRQDREGVTPSTGILDRLQITPMAIADGAGLGIAGTLR